MSRLRICLLVAALAVTAAVPAGLAIAAAGAPFLVGAARVSHDPPPPYDGSICIGGYDTQCSRAMRTVKDPLFARSVAFTGDGGAGDTAVVVHTTSIGLFAAYKAEQGGGNGIYDVRQEVASRIPVPADAVVIQSDHSHSGPDVIGLWGGVPESYLELLRSSIVESAVQAYQNRTPATLSVASVIGPPTSSSYSTGPNAGHDDEFRLLVADDLQGRRLVTLSNYSPHATVIGSDNEDAVTGDWTSWAAQEAEAVYAGFGIGVIGSIGSMDWNKVGGDYDAREAEARQRLRNMMANATAALQPVTGTTVTVQSTFIREALTQPVLGANYVPGVLGFIGQEDVRIDRAVTPPWLTGTVIGTFAGAIRLGDVFVALAPGEAFPQINDRLRESVQSQDHFFIGAANDFLGYMTDGDDSFQQVLQEGALFLAGCPEEAAIGGDPACPDHFTLMVSPTMGTHVLCTIQNAAATTGFTVGTRNSRCGTLTRLDGVGAPAENPGLPKPSPSPSPSADPSRTPSEEPSGTPSEDPSDDPSPRPSDDPAPRPSDDPSEGPSDGPSEDPSVRPSDGPTDSPSDGPSEEDPAVRSAQARPGDEVLRVAGAERVATAVELSEETFAPGSQGAVLARSEDFPDALSASTLAAAVGGPVLLTPSDRLDGEVAAELDRLEIPTVYLAGGEAALSAAVERELTARGFTTERLAGEDRFQTAALVAREVVAIGGFKVDRAIVVRADIYPDALSAGNLATVARAPILLTNSDDVPAVTIDALRDVLMGADVVLGGGPQAIGPAVEAELRDAGYAPERLAGGNRYETSIAFADEAVRRGAGREPTLLASGTNFPDALAAVPTAHTLGGTLLLVDPVDLDASPAVGDYLSANRDRIDTAVIAGGANAVSQRVMEQVEARIVD